MMKQGALEIQALSKDRQQQPDSQRFLKFPLSKRVNGLLPLTQLQGVVNVAIKNILPVPQVSEYLLGIMNWRGEAIWILDLARILGAKHWYRKEIISNSGTAMLFELEEQTVGLLVERVSTIETYDLEQQLKPASMLPERLRPFLLGYFIDSTGSPLILLDINGVIAILKTAIR